MNWPYVWGAYLLTLAAMCGELLGLWLRRKRQGRE
jgi:heme exporter protein CcmD